MTAVETSSTPLLIRGVAQLLAAETGWSWKLTDQYAADETGIGVVAFPTDCDRAVAIDATPLTADDRRPESEIAITIRTRAGSDPFEVMAMDDKVQAALLGRWPLTLATGIRVAHLDWTSGASLGRDSADRWSRTSNFTSTVYRPNAYRR